MYRRSSMTALLAITLASLVVTAPVLAQPRGGRGPMGRGPMGRGPMGRGQAGDPAFIADRELFHHLLQHGDQIRREVKLTEKGVDTLTESDNPEIALAIQKHVASMEQRVKEGRPIHLRDPLFAEIFRHADQIHFEYTVTDKGVRVVETSEDPYVAKLIQAHAEVVSRFVKYGFEEVRRNHDVPARP